MRLVVALVTFALLTVSAVPAEAGPTRGRIPVDQSVYLMPETFCAGIFCVVAAEPDMAPHVFLDAQSSLTGARLILDSGEPLPSGVEAVLRLDCDPSGPDCGGILAEAHGQPPLRLQARGLETPPGAILRLYAFTRGGIDATGAVSPHYTLETGHETPRQGTLQGMLVTNVDPSYVPPATQDIPFSFDGRTAPCVQFVEQCRNLLPAGNSYLAGPLDASVTDLRLTVTWSALSPLAEELAVEVRCAQGNIVTGPDCNPWPSQVLTGTSPLTLEMHGLHTTTDSVYEVVVTGARLVANDPVYHTAPRQDYHVEGAFTVLVPA